MHYQNKLSNSYSLPPHTQKILSHPPSNLFLQFPTKKINPQLLSPWNTFWCPKMLYSSSNIFIQNPMKFFTHNPPSLRLFNHPKEMSKKLLVTKKSPQQTVTQILANTFKVNYNKWEVIFYSMAYFPITYYSPQGLRLCTVPCLRAILYLVFLNLRAHIAKILRYFWLVKPI